MPAPLTWFEKYGYLLIGLGIAVVVIGIDLFSRQGEQEKKKARDQFNSDFVEDHLRKKRNPVVNEALADLATSSATVKTVDTFLMHLASDEYEQAWAMGSEAFRLRHSAESLKQMMSDHPQIANKDSRRLRIETTRDGLTQLRHVSRGPTDDTSLPLVHLRLIYEGDWILNHVTVEPGTPKEPASGQEP